MGFSDYIWPFKKKFSQIPCAREASITALLGGTGLGAVALIATNKGLIAYKTSCYAGAAILLISFGVCRYEFYKQTKLSEEFKELANSGKID